MIIEVNIGMKEQCIIRQDFIKDYTSKDKKLAKKSIEELIASLTKDMKEAAKNLDFEQAANLRDIILELKAEINNQKVHLHFFILKSLEIIFILFTKLYIL